MNKKDYYDEFMDMMGFNGLPETERETVKYLLDTITLDKFIKSFLKSPELGPNLPYDSVPGFYTFFSNIYILKYLLESNSKSDKIIEQNNQIIELLQKIADK